jgi:CRP/FNR family nitrogen fixation transcriptional regulator
MQIANQKMLASDGISIGPSIRDAPLGALDALEQFSRMVLIRRTHDIYKHDEPTDFCWMILSGCARKVHVLEDGRRQIREFGWPGDLIGMDGPGTYYSDAEAVTDVALRRYPRPVIEARARSDVAFALWLRMITEDHLREAHRQMVLLGRKTAAERIASFLLQMNRRSPSTDGQIVQLPMNRTDIADHLGLSIETVCRNLVNLQREGIVTILRSGVVLLDRAVLLKLARE